MSASLKTDERVKLFSFISILFFLFKKTATITHLSVTEIRVFEVLCYLFFGMLCAVTPVLCIGFSARRIFKKKWPFTSKIQYFKVASRLLIHPKKNQPRYTYGFLSIIRSDRPEVFLQVTFLLKMDFESITYIKSVVLPARTHRSVRAGTNWAILCVIGAGVEPATPTSIALTYWATSPFLHIIRGEGGNRTHDL